MNRTPAKCPQCRLRFTPEERGIRIHPACVDAWYEAHRQKQAKKAEAKRKKDVAQDRKDTRIKLEAFKPRSKWLAEAQVVVNRYVRVKALSRGEGCYTCGATPEQKFGGTYDASHFRSVGSAPHLRFWIPQIRLGCITCNRHKGGCLLEFRKRLVAEHGAEWVEALEARQEVAKFDIDYAKRIKAVIGKRLRRLEAKNARMA